VTKLLRIAPDLTLPLEAVTQAIGIVAKRRVGKSYTARRFAEQLIKAGQQVVVADPKGDWWGIRFAADGKSPGLPVVILGGEHGDLPLTPDAGDVIAKLVVGEGVNVVLDLSQLRKKEVARFMTVFMEDLYRLKAKEANRTPLMFIVDEADAIMPQKPMDGEERMLGAGEDIVRRGGQRGLGCMLITQRTAVLNKNVLTQCEMLVALRTISPQDLKAMKAWIDVHGTDEEGAALMSSLPALPVGQAWFWSPGWPTKDGIFSRVNVLPIETFDSGATPKSGERRFEPKNPADVDLAALERQMAATIEKAKADDPKALRAEIASLKKQLAAPTRSGKTIVNHETMVSQVDAALRAQRKQHEAGLATERREHDRQVRELCAVVDRLGAAIRRSLTTLEDASVKANQDIDSIGKSIVAAKNTRNTGDSRADVQVGNREKGTGANHTPVSMGGQQSRSTTRPPITPRAPASQSTLTGARLKIARGLAELEAIGVAAAKRTQLSFYIGISFAGGYGSNTLGAMRTDGLIEYPSDGCVALTAAGRAAAGEVDPPSSLDELHARVRRHVSGLEERIFDAVVALGQGGSISREALGEQIGASFAGGYGSNTLGRLRTAGIIDYPSNGMVGPSDLLFPEGLS
jgi:uncharacterized protein